MTGSSALEIRGLVKCFDRPAVDGLDLTVRAGEFYTLVGPNGAGKTTTLRMIVGLLRPDAGTIHVGGIDALAATGETFFEGVTDSKDIPFAVEDDEVAAAVDGRAHVAQKDAAMRAYPTQIMVDGPFFALSNKKPPPKRDDLPNLNSVAEYRAGTPSSHQMLS